MADASSLEALVEALRRLPGVGVKSASRMAFHMLQHDRAGTDLLARALQQAAARVRHCDRCNTFTEGQVCNVCLDPRRDATKLCVVETPADQAALERTGASVKVLQRSQCRTCAAASCRERAIRCMASRSCCSRWKAMREADLAPTPGNRRSASTSASSELESAIEDRWRLRTAASCRAGGLACRP